MVHPFSAGCNYFFSIIDGDVKNASIPNQTSKKNKTAKPNHQNSESAHHPTTKPKKNRKKVLKTIPFLSCTPKVR